MLASELLKHPKLPKPKILIVDDVMDNIVALSTIFNDLEIEIIAATSGLEALEKSIEHRFALILLDIQMPEMDGYETAEYLRVNENTSLTPIIFVTANSRELRHEIKGYDVGAIDYITKPINRSIVLSKLRVFLELYHYQEHLKLVNYDLNNARLEAESANEVKARFLANMSHEIRTPMNGMIGMIELLLHTTLDEKQKKYTNLAYKSGQELIYLINDILDYSKIEAGQLDIEALPFSLTELCTEITETFRAVAQKSNVSLAFQSEISSINELIGDQHRVRQILSNFINNAIKFSKDGCVTLSTQLDRFEQSVVYVTFKVIDTGIGIPEAKQHLLFKKFSQVSVSTTREFGGTGLGLAISKLLVDHMGGTIGVESVENKGSTFWFTLPFEIVYKEPNVLPPKAIPSTSKNRVLFIGIEPMNSYIFAEYAEKWKIDYTIASPSDDLLTLLTKGIEHRQPYHIVFIGEEFPESTRLIMAEAITQHPELQHTELILISALSYQEEWELYRQAGFTKNLVLPVFQHHLFESLSLENSTS